MECKLCSLLALTVKALPTVDTPGLVAVVRTVVDFIALFGAVDAGSVAALELIGSTGQQSWGTPGRREVSLPEQLIGFE